MRTSLVVLLVGLFSLTISCAHKKAEEAKPVAKEIKKEKILVKKIETKSENNNRSFTCLVGQDERHVSIDRQAKRCEVHYTKHGDKQQVAWAEDTQDICDRAFNSIRSNIESGGFKCNDGDQLLKEEKKVEETKKPVKTAQK